MIILLSKNRCSMMIRLKQGKGQISQSICQLCPEYVKQFHQIVIYSGVQQPEILVFIPR
ncbi:hypothetical protein SAMN04488056_10563 [Cohaesibacter marisflavi]|uniref:Uncharacterized protein n=1 Tax=Cohaesibacter marisflavi TaxID=655353 RepID=A0A1I5GMD0_9HYPH|nr:hypothetical protein SAMN04488056_10563 [Cohaesibacter marisflavi]